MDPRVFFKKEASSNSSSSLPAGASLADSALEGANCSYSSYWSTQCLNGSCDNTQRRFRQCEGRPREELTTRPDGSERWAKAEEPSTPDDPRRLSLDVNFPDPFVSLFDEVRAQSQLMGQTFREAFGPVTGRWPGSAHTQGEGQGEGEGEDVQRESDDLLRGSMLDGVMGVLHGLSREAVDSFFGHRRSSTSEDPRRSSSHGDEDGDGDDEF